MTTRREVLKAAAAALSLAGTLPIRALASAERPYLVAALGAAKWLQGARQVTAAGVTWPVDPLKPQAFDPSFYTGAPGIPPFFLELYRATGNHVFLKEALLAADHITATLLTDSSLHDPTTGSGFYSGLAGIAYVLEMVHQAGGQVKYREAAQRAVDAIDYRTVHGTQWTDGIDIISGAAGSGLFLLWWAAQTNDAKAMIAARNAGHFVLSQAEAALGGLSWNATQSLGRYYPNFSHGTAGVAYFLAMLSKATREQRYLDAALKGAQHLQAISTCDANGCLIFHYKPGGEQRYYLGWCHGPAGTSRLYYALAQLTGDRGWHEAVAREVNALFASGIPEKRTPGFWNNVSQCCGDMSVAMFMLDLHAAYGDPKYLAFAHRVATDVLHRATSDQRGMRWVQAENRISPDVVIAQTGYMQGAAGLGTGLLHLDARRQGRQPLIRLPDSPF